MNSKMLTSGLLALSCGLFSLNASAAIITLESDYVRAVITDLGVLSSLRYDPTQSGTFNPNTDYISPGTPFEGFGVRVGTSSSLMNSNSGGMQISGVTSSSAAATHAAVWNGGNSLYSIEHLFFFNNGEQRVNIRTTITALIDLTNVRISRAVDPDPDVGTHGTFDTNNQRGIAPTVPMEDFVGSVGAVSGLPLGLFYSGPITHNTGIVTSCCNVTDPDVYLAGGNAGNNTTADHGIGIGFNLGDLMAGQSTTWTYAYVMGGSLRTIDIPTDPNPIPVPASIMLMLAGMAGLVRYRRK